MKLCLAAVASTLVGCNALLNVQDVVVPQVDSSSVCPVLSFHLPGRVSFPGDLNYVQQTQHYWAENQGELAAACRVAPRTAEDVQVAMYIISQSRDAVFAVKSGGHSVVANSSNVQNGIVIDLGLLNHVSVRPDLGIVDIGAGARWSDVYQELDREPLKYGVAGGRAGSVGVGGYILGGGLSIFSNTHGFSCDTVQSFDVVLGNGTMVEASSTSHPDLFRALKGGGSNIGVVVRVRTHLIHLEDYPEVVQLNYAFEVFQQVLEAVVAIACDSAQDPSTTVSVSIGSRFDDSTPMLIVLVTSVIGYKHNTLLRPLIEIGHFHVYNYGRISQSRMGVMYDQWEPSGYREHRATTTVRNNADLLTMVAINFTNIVIPTMRQLRDEGSQGGLLIAPLTVPQMTHSSDNIIGLDQEEEPLILLSIVLRHTESKRDELVEVLVRELMDAVSEEAGFWGLSHPWRYLNYANSNSEPFAYIKSNSDLWEFVLATKRKYDPGNVFGKQIHDPFRIS